jgi:hypothetical protein
VDVKHENGLQTDCERIAAILTSFEADRVGVGRFAGKRLATRDLLIMPASLS